MSKAKGTRAERKVIKHLMALGYDAHRAPASLGAFDVFAWLPNGVMRCIQVKCGQRPYLPPAEREAMQRAPLPAGATREVWKLKDYAREPVIEVL